MIGKLISERYEIRLLLGWGKLGVTYLASHVHTGKVFALKLIHKELAKDDDVTDNLLRGIHAVGSIKNAHVVEIIDAGFDKMNGVIYIAMEFLKGTTLEDALEKANGPIGYQPSVNIAIQALSALEAAHDAGILHGDMKPENVFVAQVGSDPLFVKLMGLEIPHMAGRSGLVEHEALTGTMPYMAPERFVDPKSIDQRADIYSVGMIMYRMMAGKFPFDVARLDVAALAATPPVPTPLIEQVPSLPPFLAVTVDRMIHPDPTRRFQGYDDLKPVLRQFNGPAIDLVRFIDVPTYCPSTWTMKPAPPPRGVVPAGRVLVIPAPVPAAPVLSDQGPPSLYLRFVKGANRGMTAHLAKDQIVIGRDEDVDIRLDDSFVSKKHARISRVPGGLFLEDLDSANGVYVNGRRVQKGPVKIGDQIQIGTSLIQVLQVD